MRMKRAVGFCYNEQCEDVAKGVFLLEHGDKFYCPTCRQRGTIEREAGEWSGEGEQFSEVRVEFAYCPLEMNYKGLAIVKDESVPGGKVYTLRSPLIKTDKRALNVAERMLATLCLSPVVEGEIPNSVEQILSLDATRSEFTQELSRLSERWRNSALCCEEKKNDG